eukprot:INCI14645.1.p2 GENE.INCI14645.1~~INCI14645.1.p2  ORF type:complete len:302 (-),score=52.56 INCI14645.1:1246-2151(-)
MGSIFARLRAESISKVVLDFERPVDPEQLSEECRETYIAIGACVDQTAVAIKTLTDYSDLKPVMKVVMDQKRVDEHKEALESSMGSIVHIQEFYRLADKLNEEVPKLLNFIKSDNLKDQEALCQVFTRLLDKVIQWDSLKVQRPSILNDFSFYRRNFAKMVEFDIPFPVLEQEANVISMFLAQPCPLTMGIAKKIKDARDEAASMVFANLANALCRAVTEEFQNPQTLDYACNAMTCACVIFDHTSDVGIFGSKAVKIKAVVDALGGYGERGQTLLFYMKYNFKRFVQLCPARLQKRFPGE